MSNLIAERVEKVILTVMTRSEQHPGLSHQFFITFQILLRHLEVGVAVTDQIHQVERIFSRRSELYLPVMTAGD